MSQYHLTAVIWKEGRHYVSKCPELGVASYGKTLPAARAALEEAVSLYIENARELGFLKELTPMLKSAVRYTSPVEVAV